MLLAAILAIPIALNWGVGIIGFFNESVDFFNREIKLVEFSNGQIVNMPLSHKELLFRDWTIHVDTLYTDIESIQPDLDLTRLPAVFVGAKLAVLVTKTESEPRLITYPPAFSELIDGDYLENLKTTAGIVVYVACLVTSFLYKALSGLLYMAIIIAPIVLFKFRRIGINYGDAFKAALYLVSLQLIISTVLSLLNIERYWFFLFYILLYIFFIGGRVNLDLTGSDKLHYQRDIQS